LFFLRKFLQLFFQLLYHPFSWTYDWVAYIVSLGRWQSWVLSIQPEIHGPSVLELGHGPGHLLEALRARGLQAFGLDESWQMSQIAARRLLAHKFPPNLVNGYAQHLPFPSSHFSQVVATFPSEYILDPSTLESIFRVLVPGGEFIILPGAWITGHSLPDRLAAALFRVTGQAPAWDDSLLKPISKVGFQVAAEFRDLNSSKLVMIRAYKPDLNLNPQS